MVLDEILALFCHRKYIRKGSIFIGKNIDPLFYIETDNYD